MMRSSFSERAPSTPLRLFVNAKKSLKDPSAGLKGTSPFLPAEPSPPNGNDVRTLRGRRVSRHLNSSVKESNEGGQRLKENAAGRKG